MSLINKALNLFASWAVERGKGMPVYDPGVKVKTSADAPHRVWGYTIEDFVDNSPYLTRVLFPRVFGFRPMLHKFHRPDGDRALHNHPWKWAFSIVLRGSYTEERLLDEEEINGTEARRTVTRIVRWFNVLRDTDFHRVRELHGEEVWTLFVTGPRIQGWGFLDGDEFTEWRTYIDRKKAEHEAATKTLTAREALRDVFAELDTMTADELDVFARDALRVKRNQTYRLQGTVSVVDTIETDDAFRVRIKAALLAEPVE